MNVYIYIALSIKIPRIMAVHNTVWEPLFSVRENLIYFVIRVMDLAHNSQATHY